MKEMLFKHTHKPLHEIMLEREEFLKLSIQEFEKKYSSIFVEADLGSETAIVKVIPVQTTKFYVSVFNCQSTLYKEKEILDDQIKNKEKLEEIKNKIIYEDNDGAINLSGKYYITKEETLNKLLKLLKEESLL